MYNFTLTGTKGMYNAVWKKLKPSKIGFSAKKINRDMGDWEVSAVVMSKEYDESGEITPLTMLNSIIGNKLIQKYSIQIS